MSTAIESRRLQPALVRAKTTLDGLLHSAAEAVDQGKSACEARLGAGRDAVTGYARDKPLLALGAVALAGLAIGLLLMRRP